MWNFIYQYNKYQEGNRYQIVKLLWKVNDMTRKDLLTDFHLKIRR